MGRRGSGGDGSELAVVNERYNQIVSRSCKYVRGCSCVNTQIGAAVFLLILCFPGAVSAFHSVQRRGKNVILNVGSCSRKVLPFCLSRKSILRNGAAKQAG